MPGLAELEKEIPSCRRCRRLVALREKIARRKRAAFRHGAVYGFPGGRPALFVSYHPSRRNTQTGLLTPAMLKSAFLKIRAHIRSAGPAHRC